MPCYLLQTPAFSVQLFQLRRLSYPHTLMPRDKRTCAGAAATSESRPRRLQAARQASRALMALNQKMCDVVTPCVVNDEHAFDGGTNPNDAKNVQSYICNVVTTTKLINCINLTAGSRGWIMLSLPKLWCRHCCCLSGMFALLDASCHAWFLFSSYSGQL